MLLYGLLVFVHVVVCLVLIGVVLLQTGKRADLAGAFGGGGSQTAFGTRGAATVLSKATTICAVLFMVTSISLAVASNRRATGATGSVLEDLPAAATEPADGTGADGTESFEPVADPSQPGADGEYDEGVDAGVDDGSEPSVSEDDPQSDDIE